MDEAAWNACRDPAPMLRLLRFGTASRLAAAWSAWVLRQPDRASRRKLDLFVRACYRRVGLLRGGDDPTAVLPRDPEAAARRAARAAADRAVRRAGEAAWEDETRWATEWDPITARRATAAAEYEESQVDRTAAAASEASAQCALLRCIFGNPFRPLTLDPAVRTATVRALARAAYDRLGSEGELDRTHLGVLADALEEAGAAVELAPHLRTWGPHVPGCFVVDACLELT
jgi:hypothetical protein